MRGSREGEGVGDLCVDGVDSDSRWVGLGA